MPKARQRKTPVTRWETGAASPSSSRSVIRQFHQLLKRRMQLQSAQATVTSASQALADVDRRITELGGLECYQRMSVIGQGTDRGGGSELVLISWLNAMRVRHSVVQLRRSKYKCVIMQDVTSGHIDAF